MNTSAKSHPKPAAEVRAFADHQVIVPKANLKSHARKVSKADDDSLAGASGSESPSTGPAATRS